MNLIDIFVVDLLLGATNKVLPYLVAVYVSLFFDCLVASLVLAGAASGRGLVLIQVWQPVVGWVGLELWLLHPSSYLL